MSQNDHIFLLLQLSPYGVAHLSHGNYLNSLLLKETECSLMHIILIEGDERLAYVADPHFTSTHQIREWLLSLHRGHWGFFQCDSSLLRHVIL